MIDATRVAVAGKWAIYQAVDEHGHPTERYYPRHRVTGERATGADGAPVWFETQAAAEEWARGQGGAKAINPGAQSRAKEE